MTRIGQMIVGGAALAALAGCVEVSAPAGGSGSNIIAPPGMVDECIRQIRVGQPNANITTRAPITAGPDNRVFVSMLVDGATWGCRIEDNGSYTAFPEFAN